MIVWYKLLVMCQFIEARGQTFVHMLLNRLNELTSVHFEEVLDISGSFNLCYYMIIKLRTGQTLLRFDYFLNSFISVLKFFFELVDFVHDCLAKLFFIHMTCSR